MHFLLQRFPLAELQRNPWVKSQPRQLCRKTLIDITISVLAGEKAGELYSLHNATLAHGRNITALAHHETPHQLR